MDESILKGAAQQALCDYLGYDEGKTYLDLLTKKNPEKNYSHSKSYRILKSLHELGAVAKIKDEKDISTYIPLPPTFLNKTLESKKLILYLEKIYLKNYPDLFVNKYIELALKGPFETSLVLFLIENFMKNSAIIVSGGIKDYECYHKNLSTEKLSKVKYICREDYIQKDKRYDSVLEEKAWKISNRRIILIDEDILIELIKLPNPNSLNNPESTRYVGYLVSNKLMINTSSGKEDYIRNIKKELKQIFNLTN